MKSAFFSIALALAVFSPSFVHAVPIGAPFGGMVTTVIPCTCPPFGLWIQYTPLFVGAKVPITGALYYPPWAVLYMYLQIGVPSTWELGSYIPGPGMCSILIGVPPACVPLPALGTIEYTGTSSLAPTSFLKF